MYIFLLYIEQIFSKEVFKTSLAHHMDGRMNESNKSLSMGRKVIVIDLVFDFLLPWQYLETVEIKMELGLSNMKKLVQFHSGS